MQNAIVTGATKGIGKAIPFLKESSNPVIINIGSVVGFTGYTHQAAYASSKHAITGFIKVLAKAAWLLTNTKFIKV